MSWDVTDQQRYLYSIEGNHVQMSPVALSVLNEFIRDRQKKINRPFKLLEFGSGASTSYWSVKYPEIEIYSVEGDREWFELVKTWATPRIYEYHEATNYYTTDPKFNNDYVISIMKYGPFDLILNDGAMREVVGNYILSNHENFLYPGGMYLRHDYEKAIVGDWLGFDQFGNKPPLDYGRFVSDNPQYSLITVSGNGRWGYLAELGGVWKR